MGEWRILIVEDDPVVARIHYRLVCEMPRFRVVGIADAGRRADRMVSDLRPDLVLLDLGLPGVGGLPLLRRWRANGVSADVIAITAASEPAVVSGCLRLGVMDYLVKPFAPDRLRRSLHRFAKRAGAMSGTTVAQETLDELQFGSLDHGWLPRDIDDARLRDVRRLLQSTTDAVTAAAAAAALGVARTTARRYLEYLVTVGDATLEPVLHRRGRPANAYRRVTGGTPAGEADAPPDSRATRG